MEEKREEIFSLLESYENLQADVSYNPEQMAITVSLGFREVCPADLQVVRRR